MLLQSLRFKLLFIFLLIFGIFLSALASFFYEGLKSSYATELDRSLYNHLIDVSANIDFTFLGQLIVQKDPLSEDKKIFPFSLGQSFMQIRDMNGRLLLSSKTIATLPLPFDKNRLKELKTRGYYFETLSAQVWPKNLNLTGDYRLLHYMMTKEGFQPLILQMAAPLKSIKRELEFARDSLVILVVVILLLAAVLSWWLSRGLLKPIDRMLSTVQALKARDLKARVPVPRETELKNLATAFNDLFSRLEKAFKSQERFVSDASHQIKTPLAILRGELDVMMTKSRSEKEWLEFAKSAGEEVAHLSKLVEDLLLLAQMDAGGSLFPLAPIPLDEALFMAIRRLSTKAQNKNIKIDVQFVGDEWEQESLLITGHTDLLSVLFFNLIENAIKYSPENSVINVEIAKSLELYLVTVRDQGVGVSADELPFIFNRFYRSAEKSTVDGHGLGLAIAQHLAEIHEIKLNVTSEKGVGTSIRLEIKKV